MQSSMTQLRIGSVSTDYGIAVIPMDAQWVGGWDSEGLPVEYEDGRREFILWASHPPKPRWEWYGVTLPNLDPA